MAANLSISVLRDHSISINPIEYRNLEYPTHQENWKLVIFDEDVGFKDDNIVLVAQDFYLVDGDTLIYICPVSDQETTNDRIIPYLQAEIDREALLN